MMTRPAHAFVTGPECAARRRELDRICGGFVEGKKLLQRHAANQAALASAAAQQQAYAAAARAAAAAPPVPVADMTPRQLIAAKKALLAKLGGMGC
jgi:hypothetical protein